MSVPLYPFLFFSSCILVQPSNVVSSWLCYDSSTSLYTTYTSMYPPFPKELSTMLYTDSCHDSPVTALRVE